MRKYLLSGVCLNGHTLGFHPYYSAKFIFVASLYLFYWV